VTYGAQCKLVVLLLLHSKAENFPLFRLKNAIKTTPEKLLSGVEWVGNWLLLHSLLDNLITVSYKSIVKLRMQKNTN
jgi:hypothetical protein